MFYPASHYRAFYSSQEEKAFLPEVSEKKDLPSDGKAEKAVSRGRGGDLAEGLILSKFGGLALTFSGLAVFGLFTVSLFVFGKIPPAWMITAAAVGGYVAGVVLQLPIFKGFQKMQFEFAALYRLTKEKNYDPIIEVAGKQISLGALPNRLKSEGAKLANEEKVGAVLSLNEEWEGEPLGLSLPYQTKDWKELDITQKKMLVKDHTLLDMDQLNEAALFIHRQLSQGKNIYVHCRAGHGRSAMAIAAYLIRVLGYSAEQACELIKEKRPSSTIYKKLDALKAYEKAYKGLGFSA